MLAARFAGAQGASGPHDDAKTSVVVLRTPRCVLPSTNVDRFVQLLALELAITRVQLVQGASVPDADLTIEMDSAVCTLPAGEVGVAVVRPSGIRAGRTIPLHDVEEGARPRALALAVAELVRSARSSADGAPGESRSREDVTRGALDAMTTTAPREEPTRPNRPSFVISPISSAATAGRDVPWYGDVEACFAVRFFAPEATLGSGVDVSAGLRLRPDWLSARAHVAASWTSIDDRLGTVGLSVYSAGLSLLATTGRFPELSIGPRLELGLARAAGSANDAGVRATTQTQPIALIALTTGARFWINRLAPFVDLDIGTAIAGADIHADDRRVAKVGGAFVGMRVGVGVGY